MIATVTGVIAERHGETLVVQTDGGVGYAVTVPVGVAVRLPPRGARVSLFTELVVKEDGWALYGFGSGVERWMPLLVSQRVSRNSVLHAEALRKNERGTEGCLPIFLCAPLHPPLRLCVKTRPPVHPQSGLQRNR